MLVLQRGDGSGGVSIVRGRATARQAAALVDGIRVAQSMLDPCMCSPTEQPGGPDGVVND